MTWAYGEHDCSLYPADWVLEARGVDPGARWRGRYHDQTGAFDMIRREGGMVRMFARAADAAGLARAQEEAAGHVGVIFMPAVRGRAVGGICLGGGFWSTPARDGGLWIGRTHALRVWSVN